MLNSVEDFWAQIAWAQHTPEVLQADCFLRSVCLGYTVCIGRYTFPCFCCWIWQFPLLRAVKLHFEYSLMSLLGRRGGPLY